MDEAIIETYETVIAIDHRLDLPAKVAIPSSKARPLRAKINEWVEQRCVFLDEWDYLMTPGFFLFSFKDERIAIEFRLTFG